MQNENPEKVSKLIHDGVNYAIAADRDHHHCDMK